MHYIFGALLGIAGLVVLLIFVTLSSQADESYTPTSTATITNSAPTIDSITVSSTALSGSNLTPNEGPDNLTTDVTTAVQLIINYTDLNTCQEVEANSGIGSVTQYLLSTESEYAVCNQYSADNNYDCYAAVDFSGCAFSGCSGASDTTGVITCDYDFTHFTAADANFTAGVKDLYDGNDSVSGTTTINLVEYAAIGLINSELDFGTLAVGAVSATDGVTTSIRNTSNQDLTLSTYGTDYTCSGVGTIPVENTYATTTAGVAVGSMSGTAVGEGSGAALDLQVTLNPQTDTVGNGGLVENTQYDVVYWGIQIPASQVSGVCTTNITVAGTGV